MRTPIFYVLVLLNLTILCACCTSLKAQARDGIVIHRLTVFSRLESLPRDSFIHDFKIWYNGQQSIQQLTRVHFERKNGIQSRTNITVGYIFIDPKSKTYYCYKTFSDTAQPLQAAKQLDSIGRDGGWDFYHLSSIIADTPHQLADTTINEVSYKRMIYQKVLPKEGPVNMTGYFRCDLKGFIFDKNPALSKMMNGCPLIKLIEAPLDQRQNVTQTEFLFVSDTLSQQERKVFEAWKKRLRDSSSK